MFKSAGKHMSPSLMISCLALFIALGSVGYSATGGTFILGKSTPRTRRRQLKSGSQARRSRSPTPAASQAAAFVDEAGEAPFTVNRSTKVTNLNAD